MLLSDQCVWDYRHSSGKDNNSERFSRGDYVGVVLQGSPSQWEYHAALGLIRDPKAGLAGLAGFMESEARFWSAVLLWMDGRDEAAVKALGGLDGEHARNLRELIAKPKIDVLVQLPPTRDGPFVLLDGIEQDEKFRVRNLGYQRGDVPYEPYQSIHTFYDPQTPPDFFICGMVEWHSIPIDLNELPCATIGHTSDFDVHIQGTAQWLRAFDHMLVADHVVEWPVVRAIGDVPCHAFPMVFGVAKSMPPMPNGERDIDVFMSGTLISAYQPDKARLTNQLLRIPDSNMLLINGQLGWNDYYRLIGRSKIVPTFCRHTGGLLTRAIESLAMGAVTLVQADSMHRLWGDESTGVFVFDEDEGPEPVVRRILADYDRIGAACRANAPNIRKAFAPATIASRYFRFCTVLAAAPRRQRDPSRLQRLTQKRNIFIRGPVPRMDLAPVIARANVERMERLHEEAPAAALRNDQARELMLVYGQRTYFDPAPQPDPEYAEEAANRFRAGIAEYPDNLVLRFNFMRHLVHLGAPAEIQEGLDVARAILARPTEEWRVAFEDDVMPYDVFPQFFDYRTYLDVVVHAMVTGEDVEAYLRQLLRASVHFYLAVVCDDTHHAEAAVELAPQFPYYPLWLGEALAADPRGDHRRAVELLQPLTGESVVAYRAWRALALAEERLGGRLPEVRAQDPAFKLALRSYIHTEHHEARLYSPFQQRSLLRRLAQHGPILRKRCRVPGVRVSVVVTSVGGAGLVPTLRSIRAQGNLADTEVLALECFTHVPAEALDLADSIISCDQQEFVENRAIAENTALAIVGGAIVVVVQAGTEFAPGQLAALMEQVASAPDGKLVLRAAGAAPDAAILVFPTNAVSAIGGFDESEPFFGGTLHHAQLLSRLAANGNRVCDLGPDGALTSIGSLGAALAAARTPAAAGFSARQWPACFEESAIVPRMPNTPRGLDHRPFAPVLTPGPAGVPKYRLMVPAAVMAVGGLRGKLVFWSTRVAVLVGRICIAWVREMEACPRPGRAIGQIAFFGSRHLARKFLRRDAYEQLGNAWHKLRRSGARH